MTVVAIAGQVLAHAPFSPAGERSLALRDALRAADVAIANLEGCVRPPGANPSKAGTVHASDPAVPAAMRAFGLDVATLANNHLFDFGLAGVAATVEACRAAGLAVTGAGPDLAAAAEPAILTAGGTSVAVLAADLGPQANIAYAAESRAGVNPLRVRRRLVVPPDALETLRGITAASGYEDWRLLRRSVAMPVPEDHGGIDFHGVAVVAGESVAYDAVPDADDLARSVASVTVAREVAEIVVVVLHNHHWETDWAATPHWLARLCGVLATAGASIVAVHGAPVAGDIGSAGGVPMLYGLGNLVFDTGRGDAYAAAGLSVTEGLAAFVTSERGRVVDVATRMVAVGRTAEPARPPAFV